MNILNNRNKSTNIFKVVALCLIAAVSFTLVSCDDDMDIQQSYPFTVEVMPVPNKVTKGQTVEIRCELKKEGDFANTLYTIRYFQFEGEGKLKMDNGILPAQRPLPAGERKVPPVLHGGGRRGAQLYCGGGGQLRQLLRAGI